MFPRLGLYIVDLFQIYIYNLNSFFPPQFNLGTFYWQRAEVSIIWADADKIHTLKYYTLNYYTK